MKSITVLLLLCLGMASNIKAQNWYLGVKSGYNLSSLNSTGDEGSVGTKSRSTFSAGFVYSLSQAEGILGLSIEPGYIRKGAQVDADSLDYKMHYLGGPLLLDVNLLNNKLKLSVGPELSYLLAANNHANDSTTTSILNTYDNRFEVGVAAGASVSVSFFMDLGLRYSRSFTHVSSHDPLLGRRDLYNQYLQAFVVFKIAN